jgi:sortase A
MKSVRATFKRPSDDDRAALELLAELIDKPLPTARPPLPPVTLRSAEEQREIAFAPFLLRTWLDHALQQAEWLLVLATVAFFSYWAIDGYGRDWWHAQHAVAQPSALAPAAPILAPVTPEPLSAVVPPSNALPFTTPDMERAPPVDDYLVPGHQSAPALIGDPRPHRLLIEAIGVDTPVVEVMVVDGAWQVADYAAGYHHGSALPGNAGNTVMAGHAGLRGAVFANLGKLVPGDVAVVEASGWRYSYKVRELTSVLPTQIEVMAPTPTPVLTLITCTAWDTQRLIVVADLVDARPLAT